MYLQPKQRLSLLPRTKVTQREIECVCADVCVPGYILSKLRRVWRIELHIEGKLPVVVCREREREREREYIPCQTE